MTILIIFLFIYFTAGEEYFHLPDSILPQYRIVISKEKSKKPFKEIYPNDRLMTIHTHEHGILDCIVPPLQSLRETTEYEIFDEDELEEVDIEIWGENEVKDQIAKMKESFLGTCFKYHKSGFWAYEFCPFNYIQQYGQAKKNPIFSLGNYTESKDKITLQDFSFTYTQYYENGSARRSTTVTFQCQSTNQLKSITEPITLKYEVIFGTPLACVQFELDLLHVSSTTQTQIESDKQSDNIQKEHTETSTSTTSQSKLIEPSEKIQKKQEHTTSTTNIGTNSDKQSDNIQKEHTETSTSTTSQSKLKEPSEKIQKEKVASKLSFPQILLPLKNQCGWWTYELCYQKHFRQYHIVTGTSKEQVRLRNDQEYSLGIFTPFRDGRTVRAIRDVDPSASYLQQFYLNGSPCDLKGQQPRMTEVQIFCDSINYSNEGDNTPHEITPENLANTIMQTIAKFTELGGQSTEYGNIEYIKEISTCEYQVKIVTPLLCNHPIFKPIIPTLHTIECFPASVI